MKKNVAFFGLVLALVLVGCQSPVTQTNASEEGTIVLQIQTGARLLVPGVSLSFDKYRINLTSLNVVLPTVIDSVNPTGLLTRSLTPGNYNLEIEAVNAQALVIARGAVDFTVESGKTHELSLVLNPASGNGSLVLSADFSNLGLTTPSLTGSLTPVVVVQGGPANYPLTFTVANNAATANRGDIPAGYYTLSVNLKEGVTSKAIGFETVLVVAGASTTGGVSFNLKDGKFVASVAMGAPLNVVEVLAPPSISLTPAGGEVTQTQIVTVTVDSKGLPITALTWSVDGGAAQPITGTTFTVDATSWTSGAQKAVSVSVTTKGGTTSIGPYNFLKKNVNYTTPDSLGALYTPSSTTFRIWSPDNSNVQVDVNGQTHTMLKRLDFNGYTDVYEVVVQGDLKLKDYQFKINGKNVRDPYGFMVKPNENVNIVMDMKAIEPVGGWVPAPVLEHRTDAIIYEVHIRDFTQSDTWNGTSANRGRFLGMVETGTTYQNVVTGIDHLKEMGVTHVQILPFYDFATPHYNWGYDPKNWNVPEEQYSAAYAANPTDYEGRVREVMTMVNEFHKNGIRVVMDVVYNHTFGNEMFQDISMKYYTGNNDSGTGNGINTGTPMVSRLIQDSQEFWAGVYRVDGFRHDLLGIFHTDEVRKWGQRLNNEAFPDRNLVIYGEPWNGYYGDPQESQKVRYGSVHTLKDVNIGVFNGGFREAIKGQSDDPHNGYMFNDFTHSKVDGGWSIYDGVRGSPYVQGDGNSGTTWGRNYAASPAQTINYITAHDNFGLWDRAYIGTATNVSQNNSKQVLGFTPPANLDYPKRVVRFGMGIIFTSQGLSFTHAGEEMLRTKTKDGNISVADNWRFGASGGTHNTYNSPDSYNMIRWNWKVENAANYKYFKDLIAIRKANAGLRMRTNDEIAQRMTVSRPTAFGGQVITSHIQHPEGVLFVVYNSGTNQNIALPAGTWTKIADTNGASNVTGQTGTVSCEGTAVTIFKKQ